MNCFAPLPEKVAKARVLMPERVFDTKREDWKLIPKASTLIDADGVKQDIIVYEPTKVGEYDIEAYIHSFADEIGIQNILKKVALTGDKSYLNQTGRINECPDGGLEEVKDYTNVPTSKTEAFNAVAAGVAAYDSLPEAIKEKMSFTQFAESFGQDQFNAYVEKLIAQYAPKKEEEAK